jgi:hypothetical protein
MENPTEVPLVFPQQLCAAVPHLQGKHRLWLHFADAAKQGANGTRQEKRAPNESMSPSCRAT